MVFDWHGGVISSDTRIDAAYRNTQNVRRFLLLQCGAQFRFDRDLMAWIRGGAPLTVGDIADEWKRRRRVNMQAPVVTHELRNGDSDAG